MNMKTWTTAGVWLLACILLTPLEASAGSGATLNEVWMQYGGARPQYNALTAPTQMNTGGAGRRDPASLPIMAPMKDWPAKQTATKRSARRTAVKKSTPSAAMSKTGATQTAPTRKSGTLTPPAARQAAPVAMPASTPAPTVGNVQTAPALNAAPAPQAMPTPQVQ